MLLPQALVDCVTHVLGDAGRAWLDALPSLLAACERDYELTIGPPFELSCNYVAPATLPDGTEAVLKLSPHGQDFWHELATVRHYDGHGMVRLLEADDVRGIALFERLRPGTMLVELDDDDRQTEIAAGIMLQLRREPRTGCNLPTTLDWFGAFARHCAEYGGAGPLPAELFERGEAVFDELVQSSAAPVLLHGDLHHYNILSAQRAPWLAIDPHGVVGEPAFEVGAFFGNPFDLPSRPQLERVLERRARIFAELLGLEYRRIIDWAFAYRMLSAVWSAENGGARWRDAVAVATVLDAMRRTPGQAH
jgi:streptomycin 6-kinase